MTDRITPDVIKNIEQLLNDNREKYSIPLNIRLFVVDTQATQEENLLNAVRCLFTGHRIKKQSTYESILNELHMICDPVVGLVEQ